jgi:peptide/nickel transport system permease protein
MTRTAARIGVGILAAWAVVAVAVPVLPLRDPGAQPDGLVLRNLPPLSRVSAVRLRDGSLRYAHEVRVADDGGRDLRRGETWAHVPAQELLPTAGHESPPLYLLGTDAFGRDLWSRLLWGARVSLAVGLLAAAVALGIGGSIGLIAGLAGGAVDGLLMRATDAALAIPRLFLLVLLAALFRPSLGTTVLLVGATTWMTAARLVRAAARSIRGRDFVAAARSAGGSPLRVAVLHVLPHAGAVLGVEAAMRLGQSVLLEASLSFLGLGVPPPAASWGGLIADGRDRMLDAWWIAAWPGLAIVSVVLAASLVADGSRESL